jgi:pyruvate,water dikinase
MTTPLLFASPQATLETAGGKGANLARLSRAGFPVPRGLILPTGAYREFVSANRLEPAIQAGIAGLKADAASALESASPQIRLAYASGKMTALIEAGLLSAYPELQSEGSGSSTCRCAFLSDITEVGGMMTHGSVVAREMGIPAVEGVHQATLHLQDGQRIRLDGTRGKVTLL